MTRRKRLADLPAVSFLYREIFCEKSLNSKYINGPKGTGGWMESIGLKPGVAMAVIAGLIEFAGGLCFAAGLITPVAGVLLALVMIVASAKVHISKGFWNTNGGYEYPLVLIAAAVGVALTGAGGWSLDSALGIM